MLQAKSSRAHGLTGSQNNRAPSKGFGRARYAFAVGLAATAWYPGLIHGGVFCGYDRFGERRALVESARLRWWVLVSRLSRLSRP